MPIFRLMYTCIYNIHISMYVLLGLGVWEILNGKLCVKIVSVFQDVAYEQTEVMPPCATNNHNDAITNQTQSVSGKNSLGTAVSFIWGSEQ